MANKFHLFIMLILHVLQSALPHKLSSLTHHADECSLLFQFKETMSINNYSSSDPHAYPKLASWSLNRSDGAANCCLWDGVECRFGHVIGLDLSSSFLYGPIDSNNSLFKLTHLHTLNLADNNFRSSRIPSAIGRLSQLAKLNLSYSGFGGEVPKQISQLRNLVSLDLTDNSYLLTLQSYDFRNLVQNSSETLRELFLSGVDIGSEVPDNLVNSSLLTSVVMSYCGLRGEFPTDIFKLPTLQLLDVRGNHDLTGGIPEFHGSSELKNLYLASTNFQGSIPSTIGNLTRLNILDLQYCAFTGTLPTSVSNLTQLTYLDLCSNKFTGSLPSSIGNLTQLRYLDLYRNEMIGQIPSSFSNLVQLTDLDISSNKFTGSLPSLESFSNLTYLSLSVNNFDRWKLPDWFGKLKKITFLALNDVNLYGEIPSSFFNLTQVETLSLSRNQLKGELPSSLLNLQNLEEFYLDGNNVTMDFYLFLYLKKLEYLFLSGNNVTLSITDSHTNETLPKFIYLYLASCNLKVFPKFLRFQHHLEYLNLENNNIEGPIPGWMWNISKETLFAFACSKFSNGF